MRLIARCPTKTDLEYTFRDPTNRLSKTKSLQLNTNTKRFHACTRYCYNTSATTYLKSVCQQFQEITQLTTFAALIKLSTTVPKFSQIKKIRCSQFTGMADSSSILLLLSRYENATPNFFFLCYVPYWVSCAINKGGYRHICLTLKCLLTFCLTLTR